MRYLQTNVRVRTPTYIYTAKMTSERYGGVRTAISTGHTKALHAEGGEEIVPHERGSDGEVKRGVNNK